MKASQYLRDAQELIKNPSEYSRLACHHYHHVLAPPAKYICTLLDVMWLSDKIQYPADVRDTIKDHIGSLLAPRLTLVAWALDKVSFEEQEKMIEARTSYTQEFIDWKLAWMDDMIAYFESIGN